MRHATITAFLLTSLLFHGCATRSLYDWGNYDARLYQYYKNSEKKVELESELLEVITKSEQEGKRVAPGLYAEYGYILLEKGDSPQAAVFFRKEAETWPESSVFMQRLIDSCTTDKTEEQISSNGGKSS